ncbi:hypothetical protein RU639_000746 [Aspergillus parasiticus]
MTSPAEQMFLFGEIIDPEPSSGLALFGYADLTAGSAIIFATITIPAYIVSDWKVLSPWISALLTTVFVRPIRAVVVGTSWLLMQLAAVRSLDDVFTTLRNLEDGVKSRIVESRLSRFVCAVVNWYFPFNRPLATVCRLSPSFICGTTTVYGLSLPAAWHVFGLVMAVSLPEEELWYHCFDVFGRLEQGRLNRRDWLEVVFCFGQETGLELRAIIRDDWQLPRLIEGEIHHLYVLAFVTTSALCAILAALSWYNLAKVVPSRDAAKLQPAASRVDPAGHETQLRGMPPTPREIDLWNMIDQCEGGSQAADGGWLGACQEVVCPTGLIEETRPRETTVIVELRQELAVKEGQLIFAQGKLRNVQDDTTAKERSLCERVAQLEQAELQTRKDQLVTLEHRLAAAEAREQQSRGHTDTEHQNLVVRNNELIAQNQELTAQCQAFQAEHNRLKLQFRDSSVAIQERDAALGRVILLETEPVTTQSSAESVVRQAQESLAHAYKADMALRQSMSDLQHTCDLTLAQERATADQAQKRASDLTAEVNDLQDPRAPPSPLRSFAQFTGDTRDVGSISTALAQSQVMASQQQIEINDLRRQLGEAKQGFMWPSEQVAQEGVQKLREVLGNEERARTEDNICWGKKTRELEDECQKLRTRCPTRRRRRLDL